MYVRVYVLCICMNVCVLCMRLCVSVSKPQLRNRTFQCGRVCSYK